MCRALFLCGCVLHKTCKQANTSKLDVGNVPLQRFTKSSSPHILLGFSLSGCTLASGHDAVVVVRGSCCHLFILPLPLSGLIDDGDSELCLMHKECE